jgi:hypothetical protein
VFHTRGIITYELYDAHRHRIASQCQKLGFRSVSLQQYNALFRIVYLVLFSCIVCTHVCMDKKRCLGWLFLSLSLSLSLSFRSDELCGTLPHACAYAYITLCLCMCLYILYVTCSRRLDGHRPFCLVQGRGPLRRLLRLRPTNRPIVDDDVYRYDILVRVCVYVCMFVCMRVFVCAYTSIPTRVAPRSARGTRIVAGNGTNERSARVRRVSLSHRRAGVLSA